MISVQFPDYLSTCQCCVGPGYNGLTPRAKVTSFYLIFVIKVASENLDT